ncbi:hypothetical protein FB567DRAFT_554596 [Paraphoma chrysanthemicola]|uniref:Uncharacterized protein n=1 Tax=Paraphoma chrysanthemicola TaxID=798071 RepID=A0A8K0VT35_9PLEO|nr:hypothetical protein FB567DRAFT_554596 [Paraphoma chrysanthemicola]
MRISTGLTLVFSFLRLSVASPSACPDGCACKPPLWYDQMMTRTNISITQAAAIDSFLAQNKHEPGLVGYEAISRHLAAIQTSNAGLWDDCTAEQAAREQMETEIASLMGTARNKLASASGNDVDAIIVEFLEVTTAKYMSFVKHPTHTRIISRLTMTNDLAHDAKNTAEFYWDTTATGNIVLLRCLVYRRQTSCTHREFAQARSRNAQSTMHDFATWEEEAAARFHGDRESVLEYDAVLHRNGRELVTLMETVEAQHRRRGGRRGWWARKMAWLRSGGDAAPKYRLGDTEYLSAQAILTKVGNMVRTGVEVGSSEMETYTPFERATKREKGKKGKQV